ncbi:MAG: Rieske (2Fe-2S) protein [Ilumatobacteraceae bacterium]
MIERMPSLDNVHPAPAACWHPVGRSDDEAEGQVTGARLLGEDWAVASVDWRLFALADRCPHRGSPLSADRITLETRRVLADLVHAAADR